MVIRHRSCSRMSGCVRRRLGKAAPVCTVPRGRRACAMVWRAAWCTTDWTHGHRGIMPTKTWRGGHSGHWLTVVAITCMHTGLGYVLCACPSQGSWEGHELLVVSSMRVGVGMLCTGSHITQEVYTVVYRTMPFIRVSVILRAVSEAAAELRSTRFAFGAPCNGRMGRPGPPGVKELNRGRRVIVI